MLVSEASALLVEQIRATREARQEATIFREMLSISLTQQHTLITENKRLKSNNVRLIEELREQRARWAA